MIRRFLRDETGASAVEYGLIVGLLSLAVIAGMQPLANALASLLGDNSSKLNQALQ